jgi:hypothetical protein
MCISTTHHHVTKTNYNDMNAKIYLQAHRQLYREYSRYRYLYFYHREELGAGSIFVMQLIDEINHIAHAQTRVSQS